MLCFLHCICPPVMAFSAAEGKGKKKKKSVTPSVDGMPQ